MTWCGDEDAKSFLRERAVAFGLLYKLAANGERLEHGDQLSITVDKENCTVVRDGVTQKYRTYNEVHFGVFAHNVDAALVASVGRPTPVLWQATSGSLPNYCRPSSSSQNLMNHLWRGETTFHHYRQAPALVGDSCWRQIFGDAGVIAAAISVEMLRLPLPVRTPLQLDMQLGELRHFSPDYGSFEDRSKYYCLERSDGFKHLLVRIVDEEIVAFWTVNMSDDNLLEALENLKRLVVHMGRWKQKA